MPAAEVVQFRENLPAESSEDWLTKKRVETKTTKNVERKIQRQVVLEDGRVIVEDVPEVTVDTVEDTQTREDSGDEDRHSGHFDVTDRDGVVSERFERNTNTRNVDEKSLTTAAAQNLGDIRREDVDRVVRDGRDVRGFVRRPNEDERFQVAIPARVVHQNQSRKKTVDREDIREVGCECRV